MGDKDEAFYDVGSAKHSFSLPNMRVGEFGEELVMNKFPTLVEVCETRRVADVQQPEVGRMRCSSGHGLCHFS